MELRITIDDDSTLTPEQRFQLLADIGEMVRRRKTLNRSQPVSYTIS